MYKNKCVIQSSFCEAGVVMVKPGERRANRQGIAAVLVSMFIRCDPSPRFLESPGIIVRVKKVYEAKNISIWQPEEFYNGSS